MEEEVKAAPVSPVVEMMDAFSMPSTPDVKRENGVTLIPRPSDDPRDPLVSYTEALH